MSIPKALVQPYVDWCISSDPTAIFQRYVGATLGAQPKDNFEAGVDVFYGNLAYVPHVARFLGDKTPARLHGVLWTTMPMTIAPQFWTLDIYLSDPIAVSLLFPNGTVSETAQIDQSLFGIGPGELAMVFEDDRAWYALVLCNTTALDSSRLTKRSPLFTRQPGAGAGRKPVQKPAPAARRGSKKRS